MRDTDLCNRANSEHVPGVGSDPFDPHGLLCALRHHANDFLIRNYVYCACPVWAEVRPRHPFSPQLPLTVHEQEAQKLETACYGTSMFSLHYQASGSLSPCSPSSLQSMPFIWCIGASGKRHVEPWKLASRAGRPEISCLSYAHSGVAERSGARRTSSRALWM